MRHTDTSDLYPQHLPLPVVLVGAGGIGSNLLPVLVKCGTRRLDIWDDDRVEPVNLQAQHFNFADIGHLKCSVLARSALALNPRLVVKMHARRFVAHDSLDGVVIAAVDSMQSRAVIFEAVVRQRERVPLFIDGRLSRTFNEWFELYCIDPRSEEEVAYYREWLYTDGEALHEPRPTTLSAHTPILLSGVVGALMARWLRDGSHPVKVTFDATVLHAEQVWLKEEREHESHSSRRGAAEAPLSS